MGSGKSYNQGFGIVRARDAGGAGASVRYRNCARAAGYVCRRFWLIAAKSP
jgi:hypothetical protein